MFSLNTDYSPYSANTHNWNWVKSKSNWTQLALKKNYDNVILSSRNPHGNSIKRKWLSSILNSNTNNKRKLNLHCLFLSQENEGSETWTIANHTEWTLNGGFMMSFSSPKILCVYMRYVTTNWDRQSNLSACCCYIQQYVFSG